MTTKAIPRLSSLSTIRSFKHHRRTFITLPGTEPQSLSASRTLPYKSSSLYTIISDIDGYSSFLPYCVNSKVTHWSAADTNGQRWPSQADLKIGWGGFDEQFTSRVFCVPGSIVEALGGEATTELRKSDIAHYASAPSPSLTPNTIFKSIRTRWTVAPLPQKPPGKMLETGKTLLVPAEETEVQLTIDFQFSNPVYAALSKAVTPKMAGVMIEAFEERARKLLGGYSPLNRRSKMS